MRNEIMYIFFVIKKKHIHVYMKKNWNEENDKFISSTHLHSITCGSNLQQEMTNYLYVQVTYHCIS